MIQVNSLEKCFGEQILLENVTFQIGARDRVGFVGSNGSGKTTLFKLVMGEMLPDKGQIVYPKNYKISDLKQHIHFSKETLLEECIQYLPKEKEYDHHIAEKILFGLGFSKDDLNRNPKLFSGGYQVRINLCKALVQEPNMLLLDEPTNYLDIISLRWLRNFLVNFPGEVILITHDRQFMDSVTTHTMGITRKNIKKIKGGTEKFYEQLLLEEEIYEKTRLNQEKKRQELQAFVDRFKAKASKARQAQSKMKFLNKLETLDSLDALNALDFKFNYIDMPGKVILEAKDLSFSFADNSSDNLFSNLSFSVLKNDRIGIIGKNGKGKSTLLNVLAGELIGTQGKCTNHPSLKLGHFGQTNVERLSSDCTIIQEIASVNGDLTTTAVRNICGTMMFEGTFAEKKIKVLSGGEKSRVLLGKILARQTNLLLLDEPTNHLDMDSVESLKEAIEGYPGAIIMVTHSEHLLRELVNKLIVFQNGKAELFNGTYDEFLQKIGWIEEKENLEAEKNVANNVFSKDTKKELRQKRSKIIEEKSKECKPLEKEVARLEETIIELEDKLSTLNSELETSIAKGIGVNISEISKEIAQTKKLIQDNFLLFEEKSGRLEELRKKYDLLIQDLQ